jgi:outer membrane protein assembly factor BamB
MKSISMVLYGAILSGATLAAPPPPTAKEPTSPFLAWKVKDEVERNAFNSIAVLGNLVVVGTDRGELIAIDPITGKSTWKFDHGKRIYHSPCGDGDRVYFTSEQGVTALRAKSGILDWTYPIKECDGPILVLPESGFVYVGGHDGRLYTLETRTGLLKWTVDFLADAPKDPPGFVGNDARMTDTKARPNSFAADGETLYLTVMDQCRVVTFDAKTGKRKANYQTTGWVYGRPVVTKSRVYFGSQDKGFYAFDRETGTQVWRYEAKGRADEGGAVDEDAVYFGSSDGILRSVNLKDGKERWTFNPFGTEGRQNGVRRPIVVKGTVYFASSEGVAYAVAAHSGDVVWKLPITNDSNLFGEPRTDGKYFYWLTNPIRTGRRGQQQTGESAVVAVGVR